MRVQTFALTAAALILLTGLSTALGNKKVQCDVMTIQASNAGKGVDTRLKKYERTFKQPPFSAYNTYELVHRQTYTMPANVPVALRLPKSLGGTLKLNKVAKGELDLTLSLTRKDKSPVNIQGKAAFGAPFFAAGFKNPDGVWIFGVVCGK